MQELLSTMVGKKVDIVCSGAAAVRGEVAKIQNGIVYVEHEEKVFYVAVDKIVIVSEVKESESRAGFVSGFHKA